MDLMEGTGEQKSARDPGKEISSLGFDGKQVYFRMCENSSDRLSSSIHRRLEGCACLEFRHVGRLYLNSSAVLAVQFLTSEQRTNYSGFLARIVSLPLVAAH